MHRERTPPRAEPIDTGSESGELFPADHPETAELERLYQQALNAMEALDFGLQVASTALDASKASRAEGELIADFDCRDAAAGDFSEPQPASVNEPPAIRANAAPRLTPRQIIEAALFVGGMPLTSKKLATLLRGEFDQPQIEQTIDSLNAQYADEQRPYEIRLGEGGYRLLLRSAYEKVRNRAFGMGPKEIKLSQEALEVLALVAYQQPISREQIEQLRQIAAGGVLRQLLRLELIAIERAQPVLPMPTAGRKTTAAEPLPGGETVFYRTTNRFLEAFGLGDLDELPQAEELNLK